jgi:hypothetical protein
MGTPGDQHEQEADRTTEQIMSGSAASGDSAVINGQHMIVEDDARQVEAGQMRRSEFLARLREDVCRESDDAMRATGQSTDGCPYVQRWFDYYSDKPASHIERALRRYAPEAASATSASDYIRAASARVRRSVEVWATTGEVTGVPEELAWQVMGGGILGAIGGAIGGVVSGIASAIGGVVSGIGSAISGIGRLLFKAREGGTRRGADAGQVKESLGGGESLDGEVKGRMEGAFGQGFTGVRVHRDGRAAEVADQLNARAVTVGEDIVFGSGEYQPGTMIGDALIAHELAHVVQQGSGGAQGAVMRKGEGDSGELEEDADVSAAEAVTSIWGKQYPGLKGMVSNAMPRLRSGLRLQRCPKPKPQAPNLLAPGLAPTKDQLRQEADLKKASDERFAKNPDVYDVDFMPDVTVVLEKEAYCFDFSQPDVDTVCLPPERGTDGCTNIEVPDADKIKIKVKVDRQIQRLGATDINSPLKVSVTTFPVTFTSFVQTNTIKENKPLAQNSTMNEELHHLVNDFEMTQIYKERVARAIRLRLMEARQQAARDPKNSDAFIGQKAIEKIVEDVEIPLFNSLSRDRKRREAEVHTLIDTGKAGIPKLPQGWQMPPIKIGARGSVTGNNKDCR